MKKEIEILLKRAEGFTKDALEDLKRGDYDLAMFHIEQACQLMLKAKLLELAGYYEIKCSLRKLLDDISTVFKKEEIEEFVSKNWTSLRNLEFAYITSRYLPEEFKKEEVEGALELYIKLREILWSS
jgi:HEPN domain-containing protein